MVSQQRALHIIGAVTPVTYRYIIHFITIFEDT